MSREKQRWSLGAVLVTGMFLAGMAQGAIVYTSGASDGVAQYQTWMNGNDKWVSTSSEIMGGCYNYYGGADRYRAFPTMQFPVSQFAGMEDVTATLRFDVIGGSNINWAYVRFHDANGTGAITYNQGAGGTKITGTELTGVGRYNFDVSAQVQTALAKNYDWITFNLAMTRYDMSVSVVASENTDPAYAGMAPQLEVVPEPLSAALLGLGSLVFARRRR